jgi:hypothetical protein
LGNTCARASLLRRSAEFANGFPVDRFKRIKANLLRSKAKTATAESGIRNAIAKPGNI